MKVIVPTNNKGGVGKTKVSILLAEYFSAVLKKKVLAIDFDPQCNFSRRFIPMENDPSAPQGVIPPIHPEYDEDDPINQDWDGRISIADIFFKISQAGLLPYQTHIKDLEILPGHGDRLQMAEAVRRSDVVEKIQNRLSEFLSDEDVKQNYDVVIIDTAPSKGHLTTAAIKAATHMLIPSLMEEQPIQGVYGMLQLWKQESLSRETNKPLDLIGILPNLFRQINLHKDMLLSLKENTIMSQYVMPVMLSQRAVFSEVDTEGSTLKSVFDLPDSNAAKIEAVAVCDHIAQRVFKDD